ncbi:trehalose-phosphatase [Derxia gummosa]|uniref:Trehalose 6-phosphate phosphatase n=1 Tax=Derxia gummosa DSM 723 TaxID=1121388 RepID=A0A8B6X2D7_9BURK|nr:trehalose-phosphatase [Derxia gummosa]
MKHLFSPEGEAALADLLRLQPLLAFDFDGTLAPIVARPEDARVAPAVSRRLARLTERWPVAVVTGRQLADVRDRLGFEPGCIVGNHGAENLGDPAAAERLSRALDGARDLLAAQGAALAAAGVSVEDKGQSLALHYRLARDRDRARIEIESLLARTGPELRSFGGKLVFNLVAADAPDKASAVHALVRATGAGAALFAGDDLNDEPVFAAAEPHWLTIKVGHDEAATGARFFLDSPAEMPRLLDRILAVLDAG